MSKVKMTLELAVLLIELRLALNKKDWVKVTKKFDNLCDICQFPTIYSQGVEYFDYPNYRWHFDRYFEHLAKWVMGDNTD